MTCWVSEIDKTQIMLTCQHMSYAKLVFAAELAEMLSTDMQKEGLRGRTLTLKLKTSSFEVLLMSWLFYLTFVPNTVQEQFCSLVILLCRQSFIGKKKEKEVTYWIAMFMIC